MARKTVVTFVDDVDGSEAVEIVRFGLDGIDYEIDLNEANAAKLRGILDFYREKGRRAGLQPAKAVKAAKAPSRPARRIKYPELEELRTTHAERLSPEQWAVMRPLSSDDQPIRHAKLTTWCRVKELNIAGRQGAGRHVMAYHEFFSNEKNWAIPKESNPGRSTPKAAGVSTASTVLQFKSA